MPWQAAGAATAAAAAAVPGGLCKTVVRICFQETSMRARCPCVPASMTSWHTSRHHMAPRSSGRKPLLQRKVSLRPSRAARDIAVVRRASSEAEAAELKKIIYTAAKGTDNGIKASEAQREAIKGAINKLVKINPTKAPAKSDKSTGVWNLVYTTSSESSAGKLGPFVGKVTQDVDVSTVKYVNVVDLGLVRGELGATWTVENASQWRVIFQNIKFSVLGVALLNKEISAEGLWTLSYLDDDFRILTARSLARSDGGNVYILAKGA
eukprot:TRINITY_DN6004_c1_g1_i1.p1 TRINITY_DN6004_c1_g1~~TRINITY_DN6004_c1_g1_i1.p1  ORF type:complete len:275 (+),score=81.73 TRINITY_DN6004_c1_g1_i1:30-827(+)